MALETRKKRMEDDNRNHHQHHPRMASSTNELKFIGSAPAAMSTTDVFSSSPPMCGWAQPAVRDNGELYSWTVEPQIPIMCSEEDSRFMTACVRAGYRCWLGGTHFFGARLQLLVLKQISVYWEGPPGQPCAPLPVSVCTALLTAAADAALHQSLFGTLSADQRHRQDAELAFPSPFCTRRAEIIDAALEGANLPPALSKDIKFACLRLSKIEEERSPVVVPCFPRIPQSRATFELTNSHAAAWRGVGSPSPDVSFQVPSALLVFDNPQVLMLSAALFGSDGGSSCLFVAPRQVFPAASLLLERALGGRRAFAALATHRDLAEEGCSAAPLVLCSLELIQSHNPYHGKRWKRVCLLDWPHSAQVLRRARVKIPADFTAAFALESALSGLKLRQRRAARRREALQDFSELFEVPHDRLELDPEFVERLVSSCVVRFEEFSILRRNSALCLGVPCAHVAGPDLSEAEHKRVQRLRGPARTRTILFGPLCVERGPFSWIPRESDVQAHFRKKAPHKAHLVDAFAVRSYQAQGAQEACPICFDSAPSSVTLCGHWFCGDCLLPALETAPACPMCKAPTDPATDVVSLGKPVQAEPDRSLFFDFVADVVRESSKTIVICSHGEMHERFASLLRKKDVPAQAWRGNAAHLLRTFQDYCHPNKRSCLLVDPASLDTTWCDAPLIEHPPRTDHIVVVAPLLASKGLPPCCQLRSVLKPFYDDSVRLTVVSRNAAHLTELTSSLCPHGAPSVPKCRADGRCVRLLVRHASSA